MTNNENIFLCERGLFQDLEKYDIDVIYNDDVSEVLSFFKKTADLNGTVLDKKEELNIILKDNWENHEWDRVKGFIHWLTSGAYQKWVRNNHPRFSGLEWDFFLKMEKEPKDNYFICKSGNILFEFINEVQRSLMKLFYSNRAGFLDKNRAYQIWINNNGGKNGKFRQAFESTYCRGFTNYQSLEDIRCDNEAYLVFKNPERAIEEAYEKDFRMSNSFTIVKKASNLGELVKV